MSINTTDSTKIDAELENGTRRLRVAFFTGNYNCVKDGVALTLNRLVEYLTKQDIATSVFAPTIRVPAFESFGPVESVPSTPLPLYSAYRMSLGLPSASRAKLKAFQPTLFHIATPDILGYRALKLAKRWNIPVVASFHTRYNTYASYYGISIMETLWNKYTSNFYHSCDRVFAPTDSMIDILHNDGIAENVQIWSRGVDPVQFNPAQRSREWRKIWNIGDDEIAVVYVGRLVKEKNVLLLEQIFSALEAKGVACRPVIVGDGPMEASLKAAMPKAVFTGFLHGDDLAQAYASSDIFLFPSQSESFGNVTLEAMASGLPVVCANASGSCSLVDDGVTGFLAENCNVDEFAGILHALIGNAALRQRIGQAAQQKSLEYDWDSVMASLNHHYLEVLDEHSAGPR